jgi:hypothetical protein
LHPLESHVIDVLCAIAFGAGMVWLGHDIGHKRGAREERRYWVKRIRERYIGR